MTYDKGVDAILLKEVKAAATSMTRECTTEELERDCYDLTELFSEVPHRSPPTSLRFRRGTFHICSKAIPRFSTRWRFLLLPA